MTISESTSPESSPDKAIAGEDVIFDARLGKIFGKIIKYALLTVMSLGLYRFWAKTHLRRYFWSSLRLRGDSFIYHGTAKELLLGFLLAFILVALIGIINSGLQHWYIVNDLALGSISLGSGLLFLWLYHFAIYRMLRYRLSRTSWRAIRFALEGWAIYYAFVAVLLQILDFITLFIFHPWIRAKLLRMRLNNMYFGTLPFVSNLSGWHLWGAYYLWWFFMIMGLVILLVMGFVNFSDLSPGTISEEILQQRLRANLLYIGIGFLFLLLSLFAYIRYRLVVVKRLIESLVINGLRFRCNVALPSSVFLYFLYSLFYFVCLGALLGLGGFMLEDYFIWGMAIFLLSYLYYYYVSLFLLVWLLGRFLGRIRLLGVPDFLVDVSSFARQDIRYGEGLFDALDIGNF